MYHTGSFLKGNSFIYHLDPRIKLALTAALSFYILAAEQACVLAVGILLLIAAVSSKIHLKTIGEAIRPLLLFIFLIFFVHLFFNEDKSESLVTMPLIGISISPAGAQKAFFIIWRFLCLIVAAVLLTMTTAPSRLIAAIKYFLKPFKFFRVPVDEIAFMISLALRLMPMLLAQKERTETAQRARAYSPSGSNLKTRIKAFYGLTLNILAGVFRKADELAAAMEARNFQRGHRTSFMQLKFAFMDYLFLLLFIFASIFFLALNLRFG